MKNLLAVMITLFAINTTFAASTEMTSQIGEETKKDCKGLHLLNRNESIDVLDQATLDEALDGALDLSK